MRLMPKNRQKDSDCVQFSKTCLSENKTIRGIKTPGQKNIISSLARFLRLVNKKAIDKTLWEIYNYIKYLSLMVSKWD